MSAHSLSPKSESESFLVMSHSLRPHGLYSPWNSPVQNTGVGSLSLLQGIFPTQELNQGLLHCRQILQQLSYQGSPIQILMCQILLIPVRLYPSPVTTYNHMLHPQYVSSISIFPDFLKFLCILKFILFVCPPCSHLGFQQCLFKLLAIF